MLRTKLRLLLALCLVVSLAPIAAFSAEAAAPAAEGTGAAITPVANIEYDDAFKTGKNQGTDLEFAVLNAPGAKRSSDVDSRTKGVQHQYAVAGSYDNGMHLIDVTDPRKPVVAGRYDCGISQGDVQVFKRGSRTYATYTHDSAYALQEKSQCVKDVKAMGMWEGVAPGPLAVDVFGDFGQPGNGTYIADITDPTNPTTASYVATAKGSHNQTVHPSGNFLFESNSQLYTTAADAGIEVFDIRNLKAPKLVAKLALPPTPGLGSESHDLTFNADGTRAYSAALSQTVVINTEDPTNPSIISVIVDPAINVHHQANKATLTDGTTGQTRDFLFIEDEVAGALGTGQCPNGGVHVYDVTGPLENAPVKVGYWNIDEVRQTDRSIESDIDAHSCTAHVFQIHEEAALMTIAYYNGGVRVVDLSNLIGIALGANGVGMKQLGFYRFPDSNTWAVKAPFVSRKGFYLYGNDQDRGFDVYRYQPDAAAETPAGQWLTPAQLTARTAGVPKAQLTKENAPYCLLRKL
jgi:hypothetical protein